MGQRVVALGTRDPEISVVAALESPDYPHLGEDAGEFAGLGQIGLPLSASVGVEVDSMIDFSVPKGTDASLKICLENKIPLVIATTGLIEVQAEQIQSAAKHIPILWAPNTSLAVNLTMKLSQVAAESLKNHDADVEILERHHRFKEDSPSGTALKFGELISEAMGQTVHKHGREGRPGARSHNEIGYHAIRVGDNPGEHTIVFAMLGEMIELTVRATNRDCYAQGALAAAKFLAKKPAGLYNMNDVLSLWKFTTRVQKNERSSTRA